MLPVADYLYRSGKGVFYPPKTTKGKKKEGKCGEKGKKMREEKREKDKGREKEGQKTTKSEMEKVISSPQPQARRRVFLFAKKERFRRNVL